MDDNQLLTSRAHHLFLVLICGIWSDLGAFGDGQSAWGAAAGWPVLTTLSIQLMTTELLLIIFWYCKTWDNNNKNIYIIF